MKKVFVLTVFAFLVSLAGCGDEIGLGILDDITVEEIEQLTTGAPNWERATELDIVIDIDSVDWEKYNAHLTEGYKHRRWNGYIKPNLWNGTYSRRDYIYITDGHGLNIYKFDLQGNFLGLHATRPSLSNRSFGGDIEKNKNRKPITDGIASWGFVVSPDEDDIHAMIVWSPRDYSRPHYVNLVQWVNGELLHGASGFGMGNAYEHWEPADDEGKPDPIWNNATFRLGRIHYFGDKLAFYREGNFWGKDNITFLVLDVIPKPAPDMFTTDTHIYIGDVSFDVFTHEGSLVGSVDFDDMIYGDDPSLSGWVRVPFYNMEHKVLYAYDSWKSKQRGKGVFLAFKPQ